MASLRETGDPLDLAILCTADAVPLSYLPVATFPFTEDRKRETAVWRNANGTLVVATKGSPETIFSICIFAGKERLKWETRVIEFAESGHKVIACAARSITESAWAGGEPDREFDFVGLLAFEDPVREGISEAIQSCQEAGMHVVMVTGDHPATAEAVAREIGLGRGSPKVIEEVRR